MKAARVFSRHTLLFGKRFFTIGLWSVIKKIISARESHYYFQCYFGIIFRAEPMLIVQYSYFLQSTFRKKLLCIASILSEEKNMMENEGTDDYYPFEYSCVMSALQKFFSRSGRRKLRHHKQSRGGPWPIHSCARNGNRQFLISAFCLVFSFSS